MPSPLRTCARARVRGLSSVQEGPMKRIASLLWTATLLIVPAAHAQEQETKATKLEGTLAKVERTGTITLGYREASFPLSYISKAGPIGYSIDLCLAVVDEIKREIDKADIKVTFKLVTSETRIPEVKSDEVEGDFDVGLIDLALDLVD